MPIRTAIIGAGFSARTFHEPFLRQSPAYDLIAASGRSADALKTHWPALENYATATELLDQSDAELVIITTPNETHTALASLALAQGRHVLIDKPMCCSLREADELLNAESNSSGTLSVFHNRRWDGDFMTVRSLIEADQLGSIRRFESHFDRARPQPRDRWRERPGHGTGIWFDLGPHLVDQALVLFGPPASITARIRTIRPGAIVDDCFDVLLDYGDFNVRLVSSAHAWGPPPRFDVQGDRGRYLKHWLDPQEDALRSGTAFSDANWNCEPNTRYGNLFDESSTTPVATMRGNYAGFFDELAQSIRHQHPVPVSASQTREVIRVLELASDSQTQGRTLKW